MIDEGIERSEYQRRREKVLRALKGSMGIVFAGSGAPPLLGKWRPDQHFQYLTGISNESGAAVIFNPSAEKSEHRIVLALRPLNPEMDRWDGFRDEIRQDMRDATGFGRVIRTNMMPRLLADAARRCGSMACLHPFAYHTNPVSPDLEVFQKLQQRIPGLSIVDQTNLLPSMRAIKSPGERRLMQKAIDATDLGMRAAIETMRPGILESDVQRAIEDGFRDGGGSGVAYNSIVGTGVNATILHYMDNDAPLEDGDLLLIDAGARYQGYAADITRAFPVNGRFTKDQKEIYTIVLKALDAAIRVVKPGVSIWDVDEAARKVIDKAGYGDTFVHGIGHQLGLEVHDVTPDGPLKAGMIITIEPGVYLADRKIGVRIEDDILVTPKGHQNLSKKIPRTIAEIEAIAAS